jgi:hypothetical protein
MGRKIGKNMLEKRIEKAQEDVIKFKKKYDATYLWKRMQFYKSGAHETNSSMRLIKTND